MNIRIFFIEFLFSCICESNNFSYFSLWTVLNLISRLINQPFPERGTLKNPADSLNFTQNQFHKRCNTSEQIYASIKFIIILSYIESKMNIVYASKDPTSLIFLCFTDCTRYMHYRTCSSMYTLFTRKLWLPYKKHQIAYIKWKIFFLHHNYSLSFEHWQCCLLVSYFCELYTKSIKKPNLPGFKGKDIYWYEQIFGVCCYYK